MELEKQQQRLFSSVSFTITFDKISSKMFIGFSGMLEATSGNITIDGLDNRIHIEDVRLNLGFCPQYGLFFFFSQQRFELLQRNVLSS